MVVTYRKNSTGQFMFELGGVVKTVKTDVDYVALGISETNRMAGANVMACSRWVILSLCDFSPEGMRRV